MRFGRITANPAQMGGVPCIRGLRIPVATIHRSSRAGHVQGAGVDRLPGPRTRGHRGSAPLCGCGSCRAPASTGRLGLKFLVDNALASRFAEGLSARPAMTRYMSACSVCSPRTIPRSSSSPRKKIACWCRRIRISGCCSRFGKRPVRLSSSFAACRTAALPLSSRCATPSSTSPNRDFPSRQLQGYRLRVGDWRVFYSLDAKAKTLTVEGVEPRGGAYQ